MVGRQPSPGVDAPATLCNMKDSAIRIFRTTRGSHAYSSPLLLRRFLELQLPELPYITSLECSSHTMLLVPDQTTEDSDARQSFLSMLCADCRYHFHVKVYKSHARELDATEHPGHMLLPLGGNSNDHTHEVGNAKFICAVEGCFYMVDITAIPPRLAAEQIHMLQDDSRRVRNLEYARAEDPERYRDIPDTWCADMAVSTLARYLEDRLAKPSGEVLKIKKRNKRFCVAFGTDFDELLRSLGFEEKLDEDDEECWYITEPEPVSGPLSYPVSTRRAHLQDILEELRTYILGSPTTPAWAKLIDAFPGYLPRRDVDLALAKEIAEDDIALLGCLREFSPQWFSWAAILLANLCPTRRDTFLDAGLRCIQERNEEASLSIIMYKSQFDQTSSVDREVQAAFDFFGASFEDGNDPQRILNKYRNIVEADASESFRTEASQHLEIISNHLGADLLGDLAREGSLSSSLPTLGSYTGRMSIDAARRLLNVEASYTAELIRDFAANVDEHVDRTKIVEALEVLSDFKRDQDKHAEAKSLQDTADFLRATGNVTAGQPNKYFNPGESSNAGPVASLTAPPGLKNIGNTCYLNSLLQYFYNVRPVREMVLNYSRFQLGLDDTAVNSRRTGGNGTPVTLEEAIVARQFIEELSRLFLELQTTTGVAASPSQKLANTALSSAKEILTSQLQSPPPPLPARPSPGPPGSPNKETTTVSVSVEPTSEQHYTVSSGSSQTLVNEIDDTEMEPQSKKQQNNVTFLVGEMSPEDRALSDTVEHVEDITMEEPPPAIALAQKISQIASCLEKTDRSGTSQQDVEEIIGNILEHLMRAVTPNGPMDGKPNLQADCITELFFTTIVNTTIKTTGGSTALASASSVDEDILNEEVVPERWITAFPHPDKERKVKYDLYEALDRYFSYELLSDGSLARYTTIRALPPIVHICIQRSDASGVKNKNPVIIPEELYLDRYMEATAGSDLWNTRRRIWAVKERIKDLESRDPEGGNKVFGPSGSHTWNAHTPTHNENKHNNYEELIDFKSELWSDFPPRSKRPQESDDSGQPAESKPSKRRPLSRNTEIGGFNPGSILWEASQRADEATAKELNELRNEEAEAFSSMKLHKYCLHAMICHGGGMNAGHYWVWVKDFKNQVWYKYNDSVVTKDSRESQQVIDELNNSGDPYYVAYVRDELKDALVEVPQRTQRAEGDPLVTEAPGLEIIDSIAIDTPLQPANSPVSMPVPEAVMEDAPLLELQT